MASYSTDPALYIYTSLTAGSSHIVTATSRLETILRANRIPFKAKDIAVDDKARMLWGRRAGKDASGRKRQFPALVQEGLVLGDIVEIEEWNEYRELKQHLKIYYDETTIPDIDHKYPESQLKKRTVKKSKKDASKELSKEASATPASSSAAPPPPPPPPPPRDSKRSNTDSTAKENKPPPSEPTARSVADEAAQKAKELRLKKARDRVEALRKDDSSLSLPPPKDADGLGIFESDVETRSLRSSSSRADLRSSPSRADLRKDDLLIDGKVYQDEIIEDTPQTEMSIDEILSLEINGARLNGESTPPTQEPLEPAEDDSRERLKDKDKE